MWIPFLTLSVAMANQTVSITTTDESQIHAIARTAYGNRGVILVHDENQTAANWEGTAQMIHARGITTINLNLRGHGETRNPTDDGLDESDYQAMPLDVLAAVTWMTEQGVEQITCLGSGLGANLCVQAASIVNEIDRVALLSPGFNYQGVTSAAAARELGERSMMIVYSDEDAYAERTSNYIAENASGPVSLVTRTGLGHGIRMLGRDPSLELMLVDWVDQSEPVGGEP